MFCVTVDEYRKSLGIIKDWILTAEIEETVYREATAAVAAAVAAPAKIKQIDASPNVNPLFDALVQGLAFAKQFDDAEAALRFVMEKRPALISAHFVITPLTQMTNDTTTDQTERQKRFLRNYERAMTASEDKRHSSGSAN